MPTGWLTGINTVVSGLNLLWPSVSLKPGGPYVRWNHGHINTHAISHTSKGMLEPTTSPLSDAVLWALESGRKRNRLPFLLSSVWNSTAPQDYFCGSTNDQTKHQRSCPQQRWLIKSDHTKSSISLQCLFLDKLFSLIEAERLTHTELNKWIISVTHRNSQCV